MIGGLIGGRYRVLRDLARGGMSALYVAEHTHTGRRVVLKMPLPGIVDAFLDERALREARALETCRSPHVVDVLDAGLEQGRPFVVLEMLEGRALDGLLATRRRLPLAGAVAAFLELLDALTTVHREGLVHRDIKPGNVFIAKTAQGEVAKLLDFGIARVPADTEAALTQAGERLGTFEYMAPEQLLADRVDARADLYGAATTFFECASGELPYKGGGRELLQAMGARTPVPRLSALVPEVPAALDDVLIAALAHHADQRIASASELARLVRSACGELANQALAMLDPAPPPRPVARTFTRAPYVTPVRVMANDVVLDGHAADISEGGLLVMVARPLGRDVPSKVRFCLPVTGQAVTVDATVRWEKEGRHRHALGLEFGALPDTAKAEIQRYVAIAGGV